ncbi:MAG: RnfABCDGE type electron transport complex subunit B [Pseudomonadota bacterium]
MNAGLVQALDDALPQTQCTRCGYPDCSRYAQAIAVGEAEINQCPPGGSEGIARLAALTGRPALPLNAVNGIETPRQLAVIDEAWCIGCTLCLKACPVDAIVGGPKGMHTVIAAQCTGCELCLPPCPVDCIALVPITGARTGWNAWSAPQAVEARERYGWHVQRLQRDEQARSQPQPAPDKRSVVAAALARARAERVT